MSRTERELLDEKIREARGMIGDMKQTTREMNEAADRLENAARDAAKQEIEKIVEEEVKAAMVELGEATTAAIDEATEKVNQEFTGLANIMMYGNKQGRGESLIELRQRMQEGG